MAFSRVELQYCQEPAAGADSMTPATGSCPADFTLDSGYFSDGGTFDNVPLGLTVELVEQGAPETEPVLATYIYMDPARLRSQKPGPSDGGKPDNNNGEPDNGSLALKDQVGTLVPAIGTLMDGELRRTMIGKFSTRNVKNSRRVLMRSTRHPQLTGNFVGHFGAFFDPAFRLYDYSAGVYDGLMNAANYLCYLEEDCQGQPDETLREAKKAAIFLELANRQLDLINTPHKESQINQLVGAFLADEKKTPAWDEVKAVFPALETSSSAYQVYAALKGGNGSGQDAFKLFLGTLGEDPRQFSQQVQYMATNPKYWALRLGQQSMERLAEIEKKSDGEWLSQLKVASVVANLKEVKHNHATWSLSSVRKKKKLWGFYLPDTEWYMLVPDTIAMDGAQTGVAVGYLASPKVLISEWGYFEWEVASFHAQFRELKGERLNYWGFLGCSFRHPNKSFALSSYGIGLFPNQNLTGTSTFGNDILIGGEVNVGLIADKLRISVGTRDITGDYDGELLTVRFGFTDIDAWLSLLFD